MQTLIEWMKDESRIERNCKGQDVGGEERVNVVEAMTSFSTSK